MIKNLVSFGCSWPHGLELIDPVLEEQGIDFYDPANNTYRMLHSYPGLVARSFGWSLEDRTVPDSTLQQALNNYVAWANSTTPERIAESFVLVSLTHEEASDIYSEDEIFENVVTEWNHISERDDIPLLQFNVLARQHRLKFPTLIESSSALEMLVIRDKPRKSPLFTEHKFPNEKGHSIISEFLIKKINSAILNE